MKSKFKKVTVRLNLIDDKFLDPLEKLTLKRSITTEEAILLIIEDYFDRQECMVIVLDEEDRVTSH